MMGEPYWAMLTTFGPFILGTILTLRNPYANFRSRTGAALIVCMVVMVGGAVWLMHDIFTSIGP